MHTLKFLVHYVLTILFWHVFGRCKGTEYQFKSQSLYTSIVYKLCCVSVVTLYYIIQNKHNSS